MNKITPKFMTPRALSSRWNLHEESLRRMLRQGKLAGFKPGSKSWRIPVSSVEEYEATISPPTKLNQQKPTR